MIMTNLRRRPRALWPLALVLALVSCADDVVGSNSGEGTATVVAPTETIRANPGALGTTTPSAASAPADSAPTCAGRTVPTSPDPQQTTLDGPTLLREDGFGPFAFGAPRDLVVRAFERRFGPQEFGESDEYPRVGDGGGCMDDIGVDTFPYPYGESVCTFFTLCLQFGGTAPDEMVLVGWWLASGDGEPLEITTVDGLGIGSTLADHDTIELVQPCRWSTGGRLGGLELAMLVSGGSFGTPDEPPAEPPAADTVAVDSITAGASVGSRERSEYKCR